MKIFLATSFSGKVDETGAVLPEFRKLLEWLLSALRQTGHEVHCAVESEGWVISDLDPEVGATEDLSIIDGADCFIGLLSNNISAGLQFELGYAVHAGKKVIFIPEANTKLGWFNQGVVNAGWAELCSVDELASKLKEAPLA